MNHQFTGRQRLLPKSKGLDNLPTLKWPGDLCAYPPFPDTPKSHVVADTFHYFIPYPVRCYTCWWLKIRISILLRWIGSTYTPHIDVITQRLDYLHMLYIYIYTYLNIHIYIYTFTISYIYIYILYIYKIWLQHVITLSISLKLSGTGPFHPFPLLSSRRGRDTRRTRRILEPIDLPMCRGIWGWPDTFQWKWRFNHQQIGI